MPTLDELARYVQFRLQGRPIRAKVAQFVIDGLSNAGRRPEEIFTREFLCPVLADYFYSHVRISLKLSDDEIRRGLGTEGYQNCPRFGFSPARKKKHLFTKLDIIANSTPKSWIAGNAKSLSRCQACPDFAITSPLPISTIGETKYFVGGSIDAAIKDLYDAARQAVFYLGAFSGAYQSATIVVADASVDQTFLSALASIKPSLLERFGDETNIHLVTIRLS